MFRVQLRDAANPDTVLVGTFTLPYDPPNGAEVRVRKRSRDDKHTGYRVVGHIYEAVIDDPHESGFALLVKQIS
jgi:hypothetical protein